MDSKSYARILVQGLVVGAMLIFALAPPAEAQGGHGKGKNRPPERPAPQGELATGEYSLNGPDILEAINRGEGPQALAYFERAAKEAEQQGNLLRAAWAWHAAAVVTL